MIKMNTINDVYLSTFECNSFKFLDFMNILIYLTSDFILIYLKFDTNHNNYIVIV